MAQVVSSAAVGLRVGAIINADLIEEETHLAVSTHRAELADLFEEPAWEDRSPPATRSGVGRVNLQLKAEAAGLEPGQALDVGSSEGADAIWLAERGWSVTGIDFSIVALERAASHAATAGVGERTEWRHGDVRTFAWEVEVVEVLPRTVAGHDGELVPVGDSVLRARRRL